MGQIDNNKPLLAVIIEKLVGGSVAAKPVVAADAPAVPAPVVDAKPAVQPLAKPQPEKPDPTSRTPSEKTPKGSDKPSLELSKPVPEGQPIAEKKKDDFDYANWKPRDRSALEGPSKEKDLFAGNPAAQAGPAKDKQESSANRSPNNPMGGTGMKQTEPVKKDTQAELPKKSTGNLLDDKPKGHEQPDRDIKRGKLEPSLNQMLGRGPQEEDLDEPEIGGYPDGTEEHLADIIDGQEEEDDPNVASSSRRACKSALLMTCTSARAMGTTSASLLKL